MAEMSGQNVEQHLSGQGRKNTEQIPRQKVHLQPTERICMGSKNQHVLRVMWPVFHLKSQQKAPETDRKQPAHAHTNLQMGVRDTSSLPNHLPVWWLTHMMMHWFLFFLSRLFQLRWAHRRRGVEKSIKPTLLVSIDWQALTGSGFWPTRLTGSSTVKQALQLL